MHASYLALTAPHTMHSWMKRLVLFATVNVLFVYLFACVLVCLRCTLECRLPSLDTMASARLFYCVFMDQNSCLGCCATVGVKSPVWIARHMVNGVADIFIFLLQFAI